MPHVSPEEAPDRDATDRDVPGKLRVDKWLWQARFFKTRGLAAALANSGRLRINGAHALKPAQTVRPGDVLTFPQGARIRVVQIVALGARRGPAAEAQALYTDLAPADAAPATGPGVTGPGATGPGSPGARARGAGRPTKRERRKIAALRRELP